MVERCKWVYATWQQQFNGSNGSSPTTPLRCTKFYNSMIRAITTLQFHIQPKAEDTGKGNFYSGQKCYTTRDRLINSVETTGLSRTGEEDMEELTVSRVLFNRKNISCKYISRRPFFILDSTFHSLYMLIKSTVMQQENKLMQQSLWVQETERWSSHQSDQMSLLNS